MRSVSKSVFKTLFVLTLTCSVAWVTFTGCSDDSSTEASPDAGPDGTIPDKGSEDGTISDSSQDGALPDSSQDGTIPKGDSAPPFVAPNFAANKVKIGDEAVADFLWDTPSGYSLTWTSTDGAAKLTKINAAGAVDSTVDADGAALSWRNNAKTASGVATISNDGGLTVRRYDANGAAVGSSVPIYDHLTVSNNAPSYFESIASGNNGFGIVWTVGHQIFFANLDAEGMPTHAAALLVHEFTGGPPEHAENSWPHLAWNGSQFGIVWSQVDTQNQYGDLAYFAAVTVNAGEPALAVPAQVVSTGSTTSRSSSEPCIAAAGSEWGVAWAMSTGQGFYAFFARLDSAGQRLTGGDADADGAIQLSSFTDSSTQSNASPQVIWNGTEYAVIWIGLYTKNDDSPSAYSGLYFTRIDATGKVVGTAQVIDNPTERYWKIEGASISSGASGYAVAWTEYSPLTATGDDPRFVFFSQQ